MSDFKDGYYRIDFKMEHDLSFISVTEIANPDHVLSLRFRQNGEEGFTSDKFEKEAVFITEILQDTIEMNDTACLSPTNLIVKMLRTLGYYTHRRLAKIYMDKEIIGTRDDSPSGFRYEDLYRYFHDNDDSNFVAVDPARVIKSNNQIWGCGWRFDATKNCPPAITIHDPEPMEFREEWLDNVGSMANAVAWMRKYWTSNIAATGETFQNGHHWHWHWAPLGDMLIVHTREQGKYGHIWYEITDNEMKRYDGAGREWCTTYRPFAVDPRKSGAELEWRITREIKIHTYQHEELVPLGKREAFLRLERRLTQAPIDAFPLIHLSLPFDSRRIDRHARLDTKELELIREVLKMLEIVGPSNYPGSEHAYNAFQDFHMPSYWALAKALRELAKHYWPGTPGKYSQFCRDEMERLIEMGEREAAALVFTFIHENGKIEEGRSFVRNNYQHN